MHPHDFNLLCCLHFSPNHLPKDLQILIFSRVTTECKLRRLSENKPFRGRSKFAMRRRAKRYNRCFDCGAVLIDDHQCKVLTSRAQSDVLTVIREGPAKLYAERTYRPNSDAARLIEDDILYIKTLKL
ncbi:nucleic acid binding protein [Garlic virus E]|uniref:Nucleic acid binding protein n=3 Tax=Garlic virus E TaxID=150285 RepID=Q8QXV8_9VIRU|nr:nucleic acid binding protein [Garlic virus E]CAC83712.1 nucleic acid binding protein [Garlic virus E]